MGCWVAPEAVGTIHKARGEAKRKGRNGSSGVGVLLMSISSQTCTECLLISHILKPPALVVMPNGIPPIGQWESQAWGGAPSVPAMLFTTHLHPQPRHDMGWWPEWLGGLGRSLQMPLYPRAQMLQFLP